VGNRKKTTPQARKQASKQVQVWGRKAGVSHLDFLPGLYAPDQAHPTPVPGNTIILSEVLARRREAHKQATDGRIWQVRLSNDSEMHNEGLLKHFVRNLESILGTWFAEKIDMADIEGSSLHTSYIHTYIANGQRGKVFNYSTRQHVLLCHNNLSVGTRYIHMQSHDTSKVNLLVP
jgi:hypothetical protein